MYVIRYFRDAAGREPTGREDKVPGGVFERGGYPAPRDGFARAVGDNGRVVFGADGSWSETEPDAFDAELSARKRVERKAALGLLPQTPQGFLFEFMSVNKAGVVLRRQHDDAKTYDPPALITWPQLRDAAQSDAWYAMLLERAEQASA
jgi:hypothetical protein